MAPQETASNNLIFFFADCFGNEKKKCLRKKGKCKEQCDADELELAKGCKGKKCKCCYKGKYNSLLLFQLTGLLTALLIAVSPSSPLFFSPVSFCFSSSFLFRILPRLPPPFLLLCLSLPHPMHHSFPPSHPFPLSTPPPPPPPPPPPLFRPDSSSPLLPPYPIHPSYAFLTLIPFHLPPLS